jgi:hypothetical protein
MTNPLQAPPATDGSCSANGHHRRDLPSQDLVALLHGLEERLATQPGHRAVQGNPHRPLGIDPTPHSRC